MARQASVSKEDVRLAIEKLAADGLTPTIARLQGIVGGQNQTVARLKAELEADAKAAKAASAPEPTPPPEAKEADEPEPLPPSIEAALAAAAAAVGASVRAIEALKGPLGEAIGQAAEFERRLRKDAENAAAREKEDLTREHMQMLDAVRTEASSAAAFASEEMDAMCTKADAAETSLEEAKESIGTLKGECLEAENKIEVLRAETEELRVARATLEAELDAQKRIALAATKNEADAKAALQAAREAAAAEAQRLVAEADRLRADIEAERQAAAVAAKEAAATIGELKAEFKEAKAEAKTERVEAAKREADLRRQLAEADGRVAVLSSALDAARRESIRSEAKPEQEAKPGASKAPSPAKTKA